MKARSLDNGLPNFYKRIINFLNIGYLFSWINAYFQLASRLKAYGIVFCLQTDCIIAFKNNISAIRYPPATDDDAGDAEDVLMFPVVDMKGPTLRRGKQQFTLEALFKAKEEN